MIFTRSLSKLPVALTLRNSFGGALLSVTIGADSLKIAETVIISCNDMVYLCGLRATDALELVSDQNPLPETIPVTRESLLASRSLPVT